MWRRLVAVPVPSLAERQAALAALARLSERDLRRIWARLNVRDPKRAAAPLAEVLAGLVGRYGSGAAALSAEWFEAARDAAGAPGTFRAVVAEPPDASKFEATARWGVEPLFGAEPDASAALSLLAGALQRMVAGMGRETTERSVLADPSGPVYARHASANACAFCRMLATRGAVYTSARDAQYVTGANLGGTDYQKIRGGAASRESLAGRKGRATKRDIGARYHDNCHCIPVAVWPSETYEPPPYVQAWREDYQAAYNAVGGSNTPKILAHMREHTGAR